MNPIPIIAFAKFQEVQKYLTLSGHIFAPYVWTMNAKFWISLTDSKKDEFRKVAVPAVKKLITEKFGAEGKEMLDAFLQAVK